MKNIIFAVVLLVLSMGGIVVRKTYFQLPVRELKRRARQQDPAARALYRAVAYGNSLRGLLWLYIGLTSAAGLILLARELHIWVSLLVIGPLLWIAFSLIPATRTTKLGTWLTVMVTPPIAWLLNYLHPLLGRGADAVEDRYKAPAHTKLFEREDLIRLIERQQHQPDNRLSQEELEIAKRALSFDDYKVADVMTARKQIKTVLAGDTIGPILIDELHQSGQEQILVRESAKGPFVGSLKFSQLGLDSEGKVRDIMHPKVSYVHENDSLGEVLRAFFATNLPVFAVVNSAEEYVGIITVENILHQLIGHIPGDDFDQYANPEAVAARHSKLKKLRETDFIIEDLDETPVKTDEEVLE
jgi:CBS domain containing-hemolysin-like protein